MNSKYQMFYKQLTKLWEQYGLRTLTDKKRRNYSINREYNDILHFNYDLYVTDAAHDDILHIVVEIDKNKEEAMPISVENFVTYVTIERGDSQTVNKEIEDALTKFIENMSNVKQISIVQLNELDRLLQKQAILNKKEQFHLTVRPQELTHYEAHKVLFVLMTMTGEITDINMVSKLFHDYGFDCEDVGTFEG